MKGHAREAELNDHIDGLLAPRRRAELEQHLATCRSCTERYAAARGTVDRLHALPRHVPLPRADAPRWAARQATCGTSR
jgi:anti-sigma factor RsiW